MTKKDTFTTGFEDYSKLNMASTKGEEGSVRVYLHTLAKFRDHKSGSYVLRSLKKMKGTQKFLEFPESKKKCQGSCFEACQTTALLESRGFLLVNTCLLIGQEVRLSGLCPIRRSQKTDNNALIG